MIDPVFGNFKEFTPLGDIEYQEETHTYDNYIVDWDRVNTLEDFKRLLKAVEFRMVVTEDIKHFDDISYLLYKEED